MRKICLLLVSLLAVTLAAPEVEDGVIVLTDNNFDEELKQHDNLLVEFYAPWCGHCKQLAPEYAKAAKRLRENNPPYYLAKVDATENKVLAERFGIKGFPTLFFFKNQNKMEYNGGRTENEIVSWILKKVGPPSQEVSCEDFKAKIADAKLAAVFFGEFSGREYSTVYGEVNQHPSVSEKFQFFHVNDKSCAGSFGASTTPALTVVRKFDESPITYSGNWETTPIVSWLSAASIPTLIDFSEDYIEPIFGQKSPALFLFLSKSHEGSAFHKVFTEAATTLKGEILFVTSGVSDGIQQRLAEFIGVDGSSVPTLRLLDPADNMRKFTYEGSVESLTVEGLRKFIGDFKAGTLVPFLKSEEIPADNSAPVKVVVGKNFNELVLNPDHDVLVKFYAPWCGHCKKLAPVWEEVAKDLANVPGLVIAKFDATTNEVDGVEIRGYPTLKFYPKTDGKKTPIDFDGDRDAESIKTWLKEKSVNYQRFLEKAGEL